MLKIFQIMEEKQMKSKIKRNKKDAVLDTIGPIILTLAIIIEAWLYFLIELPTKGWGIEEISKQLATMSMISCIMIIIGLVAYLMKSEKKSTFIIVLLSVSAYSSMATAYESIYRAVEIYGSHWYTFHWLIPWF